MNRVPIRPGAIRPLPPMPPRRTRDGCARIGRPCHRFSVSRLTEDGIEIEKLKGYSKNTEFGAVVREVCERRARNSGGTCSALRVTQVVASKCDDNVIEIHKGDFSTFFYPSW